MLFLLLSVALRDLENLRYYPLSAYFFAVFQAQRNKLLVKSVDPQYGYISSSSQGAENPSVCEFWPPRPPFKLRYYEQLALAAPQVGANSTRRCPRMRNGKGIYLKRQEASACILRMSSSWEAASLNILCHIFRKCVKTQLPISVESFFF